MQNYALKNNLTPFISMQVSLPLVSPLTSELLPRRLQRGKTRDDADSPDVRRRLHPVSFPSFFLSPVPFSFHDLDLETDRL